MRGCSWPKRLQSMIVSLILVGLMVLYKTHHHSESTDDTMVSSLQEHTGYLVYSSRCRIPDYSVWGDHKKNRAEEQLPECSKQLLLVKQLFGGKLKLLRHNLELTEKRLGCQLTCCLNPIVRAGHDSGKINKMRSICFGEDSDVLHTPHEFVRLQCQCNDTVHYEDFFATITRKPEVEARVKKSSTELKPDALSVYLIGIDSVSRLNFHRYMPRTRELLENRLGAVPMHGFTKVGKNTFPNLFPMLTGKDCTKDLPAGAMERPFDDIGFIWQEFAEAGYRTMFGEDQPQMNTFNYQKPGFSNPPTDYYMRPMFTIIKSGHSEPFCVNNRLEARFMNDWLGEFMNKFQKGPQFALTFSNFAHTAKLHKVASLDPIYERFFEWYSRNDHFNSSMLVFFSDHGKRYGDIMKTAVGRFESRTPFFYILLPPWYARVYPDRVHALRTNSRRLTTMYDMHATMLQLLEDAGSRKTVPRPAHGVSLLSEVPEDRSCQDANIDTQWCVCGDHRHLQYDEYDRAAMKRVAQLAVDDINTVQLAAVRDRCAKLEFLSLPEVYIKTDLPQTEDDNTVSSNVAADGTYVLILTTVPGYARFEAHMQQGRGTDHWTVLGFNRLDAYGNQSSCLDEVYVDELRFCFCL